MYVAFSFFWSPDTSYGAQWVIMGAVIAMGAVLLVMDCRVFVSDRRLGMFPRRSHITVLGVRFEDTYTDVSYFF